ncbi:MAG: phosphoglycerate dehydrogenase [Proteobacteria bacterium]|nr:phosphoglycerate dehydrogenase [Pseudomonadota bacterium]
MIKNKNDRVAVASRSFSRNSFLRASLLERYENVTFNDSGASLSNDDLVTFLNHHTKAITALEKITDEILIRLPDLKVIGKYGVGTDMLDLSAMEKHGIKLGWTPGVNRRSVAELALGFILSAIRLVPQAVRLVQNGDWRQVSGRELTGKRVGIIGCGHVGQELVKLLNPFQCEILVYDQITYHEFFAQYCCSSVSLPELLQTSDIVSLHLPLTDSTKQLLNQDRLQQMKQGSILINTARGGLVDEGTVATMLLSGQLAGAAFDVFEEEPPKMSGLVTLQNFIATPHIGGSSEEAIIAMGLAAINGLDHYDNPLSVVNYLEARVSK